MSVNDQHLNALPAGYRLENFRFESVLGHGGFGITYRAVDEDLQQAVAIKEYLPREVALRDRDSTVVPVSESDRETFDWGLERFLDEARTLARFRHPNIVGVRRFIRANNTAYLVMDYCEGESLEKVLERQGTLALEPLDAMLKPLLDALEMLHTASVTHRDIKPGNIYLREDGSPVLLDFGAARQALAQHSRSVTAMATPGYAAFEQYSTKGKQGPWTDIYGLGATLYRCVTGQRPPDASDRMLEGELVPTAEVASDCYPRPLLQQIDAALKLRPQDRPQSIAAWRRFGVEGVASLPKGGEVIAPPVVEPQAPAPSSAGEPAATTGRGRGRLWLLIVGAVIGFFIWAGSESPNPQPSATATRDSPVPRPAPPRSQDAADSSVPGGLIEGRYQILGAQGEIVRDTVTGLEWQRCSLGQTWSGSTCAGEAYVCWRSTGCAGEAQVVDWFDAYQAADQLDGWRLPTIDELRTLTYCSSGQPARFNNGRMCQEDYRRPTIVLEAFPNTSSLPFWSASHLADSPDTPWLVNFDNGFEFNLLRVGNRPNVRLVRGGVAGYETAGTEVDTDPAAVARNAEIERLLNALEEDLAADRLTIPSGRNALERVKAILDLSPDHEGAMEGLRRIMARYEELTSVALARGELDRAEALLRRMDEVQAGASAASDLRDQISRAREAREQEQEQARGVAATHDSPVLAATPAESTETGSATVGGLSEGRYQVIGSRGEIVRDAMTGLEWQRCSLGQSWNGQTCTGEAAVYRWKQAREAADEMGGWRLPEKNELQTLVYCSSGQPARFKTSDGLCDGEYQRPAIVAEAFPNTPIYNYWSHSSSGILSVAAWVVNSSSGLTFALNKGYRLHVRLVRSDH